MYCIALDPGGTTGVCIVKLESKPWELEVRQIGPDPHHEGLRDLLDLWQPRVIVCERFENRGQDSASLIAAEYIGIVKAYTAAALVMQNASTGKQFWTDDKLREYDLYVPGLKHARDACRHYLYYRTFVCNDLSLLKGQSHGSIHTLGKGAQ